MEEFPANKAPLVLLVDDDLKLLGLLGDYLQRFGLQTLRCPSPLEGLRLVGSARPDLIVLDVMMPGMDGFEFCRNLRKTTNTPVLMLSARVETVDRIVGLEIGADDYMAKPFEPRELLTRIQAILRRTRIPSPAMAQTASPGLPPTVDGSGPAQAGTTANPQASTSPVGQDTLPAGSAPARLKVDARTRNATLDGKVLELSTMEFELLLLFHQNPGKKFNRDEIMNQLQGVDSPGYSRSVDILVSRLRTKLGENARQPCFIKSVHGYGYVFTGGDA